MTGMTPGYALKTESEPGAARSITWTVSVD